MFFGLVLSPCFKKLGTSATKQKLWSIKTQCKGRTIKKIKQGISWSVVQSIIEQLVESSEYYIYTHHQIIKPLSNVLDIYVFALKRRRNSWLIINAQTQPKKPASMMIWRWISAQMKLQLRLYKRWTTNAGFEATNASIQTMTFSWKVWLISLY